MDITLDAEATNLLNHDSINYNASPYVLKEDFSLHCIVIEVHETKELIAFYDGDKYIFDGRTYNETDGDYSYILEDYEPVEYTHSPLYAFPQWIKDNPVHRVVAHNGINYDLLLFKLWYGMDYTINPDKWAGKQVRFEDTMVTAKTLNPDRFGGASLDNLAKMAGQAQKIEFRKSIPSSDRFKTFAADMVYYNIFDVKSNTDVYKYLEWEKGDWEWEKAITLEKEVAEIITRQEHRGFLFDTKLAESNCEELDMLMEERRQRVEPLLPPRPATKKFLKEHTPPASQQNIIKVFAPKVQFKGNREPSASLLKFAQKESLIVEQAEGNEWKVYSKDREIEYSLPIDTEEPFRIEREISAHMRNFVEKHGGEVHPTLQKVRLYGKVYKLPLPAESIKTHMVAQIDDTAHIKNWLVGLGWKPLEWKDKDITVKSGKGKVKRTEEELHLSVDKYIEESKQSNHLSFRLEHLGANIKNFKLKLWQKASKRSCKVLTNPSFTVGQEKEMCPNLEKLTEEFPYTKDIVEYLTYKHRRNSILGGGLDWEYGEDAEKGYMAHVREDGRIGTPADSQGCGTGRMSHKKVANVPRITTLFGEKMRALFGVDYKKYVQIGYDFSSLEARMEAHYCYGFDDTSKAYCNSLLLGKPLDTHSSMARRVTELLGRPFGRTPAKSVRYGCLPTDNSEVLTREGWEYYTTLKVGQDVLTYSEKLACYEWKPIDKLWLYQNAPVTVMKNKWISLESTADHRWYGSKRKMKGSGKTAVRYQEDTFFTTEELNSECSILHAAKYENKESTITEDQAALLAWILSDGYYKWSELSETTSSSFGTRKGIVGRISQAQHKYWREVEEVLAANNINYTKTEDNRNTNKVFTYLLKSKDVRDFFDKVVGCREQKHEVDWTKWILRLDQPALIAFVHHFWLADGHTAQTGGKIITQNAGNIHDAVVLAINLTGRRAISNLRADSDKCRTINIKDKPTSTGQRIKKSVSRETEVFCLTTENGTFVTRQGGLITITGNCSYGAQPPRVAMTIGCSLAEGETVFNAFWELAWPLAKLKNALEVYWKGEGKKRFVRGLDGRKIPTRAEHALINSLFQSAGVICAKKTMVLHDRLLREEGLIVDFFVDDWKNKSYCQQMIAYHDEAQLEETKKNFTFKKFTSKVEATDWAEAQDVIWSEAFEVKGVWYVGYSKAAGLISKAVDMTTEYYGLNIPLHAGYILGKTWADCH